jgi:hypothetical protein
MAVSARAGAFGHTHPASPAVRSFAQNPGPTVFVYERSADGLTLTDALAKPAGVDGLGLGTATDGKLLVVGAFREDGRAHDTGAAHVY